MLDEQRGKGPVEGRGGELAGCEVKAEGGARLREGPLANGGKTLQDRGQEAAHVSLGAQVKVAEQEQRKGSHLSLGRKEAVKASGQHGEDLLRDRKQRRGAKRFKLIGSHRHGVGVAHPVARDHEIHGHTLRHAVPQDPAALALDGEVGVAYLLALVLVAADEASKALVDVAQGRLVEVGRAELGRGKAHAILVARHLEPIARHGAHLEPIAREERRGAAKGLPQSRAGEGELVGKLVDPDAIGGANESPTDEEHAGRLIVTSGGYLHRLNAQLLAELPVATPVAHLDPIAIVSSGR